jgi:hypothetical protein
MSNEDSALVPGVTEVPAQDITRFVGDEDPFVEMDAWLRTSALSTLTTEVIDEMTEDEMRSLLKMVLPWLRRSISGTWND